MIYEVWLQTGGSNFKLSQVGTTGRETDLSVYHPDDGEAQQRPGQDVLPVVVVVRGPAEGDGERNEKEGQWEEQSPARYWPTAVECSKFA